jgi:uncharacterized protein YbaR (Trm112 family)
VNQDLQELLVCPACHGNLEWEVQDAAAGQIETAAADCQACGAAYFVRQGIGIFLTPDLPREDMWAQAASGLQTYLAQNPHIRCQLMDTPADTLTPADRFFRAQVLEDNGAFVEARALRASALPHLYTPGYLACHESQYQYVLARLAEGSGPILDLASGLCGLVKRILTASQRPVIVSDFSPTILRRNRRWAKSIGMEKRISFLAFDARCTPFKSGMMDTMTTNLGLPNIEQPGNLLKELRRICSGSFMAISQFFPEEENENTRMIRQLGLDQMLFKARAQACFDEAGWQARAENTCKCLARPTPKAEVIAGAGIDGLPVIETEMEWAAWMATPNQKP